MNDGSLLLIEAAVGLGFVGVCTIPAVGSLAKQLYRREQKKDSYEDSDGKATPESLSTFSNKWAKIFVVVFACVGLGCQIAQSVLSSMHWGQRGMPLGDHLVSAAWVGSYPNDPPPVKLRSLLSCLPGTAGCPGAGHRGQPFACSGVRSWAESFHGDLGAPCHGIPAKLCIPSSLVRIICSGCCTCNSITRHRSRPGFCKHLARTPPRRIPRWPRRGPHDEHQCLRAIHVWLV